MAKIVDFDVYVGDAHVGAVAHEAFWNFSQGQADAVLLASVHEAFPNTSEYSKLTMGADKSEAKDIRRYGGEVFLTTGRPNGTSTVKDDGKERNVVTRKQAPAPSRDERALAWLMDGRMSDTLENAFLAVDTEIATEREAANAEARIAIGVRLAKAGGTLSTLMGQFASLCELYGTVGGELDDDTLALYGACVPSIPATEQELALNAQA